MSGTPRFEQPGIVDRIVNTAIGALLRLGIGLPHMRLLEVRGRRTGTIRRLPVDPLVVNGRLFLVAPRGRTQWVRNAEAAGSVVLRRGREGRAYGLRALDVGERPPVLKAYLEAFPREVHRFFPVPPGAPVEAFVPLAPTYPVFELTQA